MPSRASRAVNAPPTRFRREVARLVSDGCRRSRSRRRSRVRRFVEVAVEVAYIRRVYNYCNYCMA